MLDRSVITKKGTAVQEKIVQDFEGVIRGEIVRPGDESYETARRVWNGMIDRRPSMVVYCSGTEDVVRAVDFAGANDLLVAVRSGGHNVAGNAVCDDGLVIDLSRMKGIEVDAESLIARAQAGLTWGEFDRSTQAYGLATTGGIVSRTGIAGLTLGGGIGWLMRQFGATCDNLFSVNLVLSDGRLVSAGAHENPDLFWGVRGGGGNFGIVTDFEYRLHKVGPVLAGTIYYPAAKVREILRLYRDYIADIPDELTTMFAYIAASSIPFRRLRHGSPIVAVHICYTGSRESGEQVLRPLRASGPPIEDSVRLMPYVELQSMLDAGSPPGLFNYWKSCHLKSLSDQAIEALSDYCGEITSPLTQVHIQHLQGAIGRVPDEATAFGHREALCVLNIVTKWEDRRESDKHVKWTQSFEAAMKPFSTGGVYVNFLGEEGENRVRDAYGPSKYARLAALKNKYDPTNFFRLNQNIRPSVSSSP